jgi:hypothetical protein
VRRQPRAPASSELSANSSAARLSHCSRIAQCSIARSLAAMFAGLPPSSWVGARFPTLAAVLTVTRRVLGKIKQLSAER